MMRIRRPRQVACRAMEPIVPGHFKTNERKARAREAMSWRGLETIEAGAECLNRETEEAGRHPAAINFRAEAE